MEQHAPPPPPHAPHPASGTSATRGHRQSLPPQSHKILCHGRPIRSAPASAARPGAEGIASSAAPAIAAAAATTISAQRSGGRRGGGSALTAAACIPLGRRGGPQPIPRCRRQCGRAAALPFLRHVHARQTAPRRSSEARRPLTASGRLCGSGRRVTTTSPPAPTAGHPPSHRRPAQGGARREDGRAPVPTIPIHAAMRGTAPSAASPSSAPAASSTSALSPPKPQSPLPTLSVSARGRSWSSKLCSDGALCAAYALAATGGRCGRRPRSTKRRGRLTPSQQQQQHQLKLWSVDVANGRMLRSVDARSTVTAWSPTRATCTREPPMASSGDMPRLSVACRRRLTSGLEARR